VIVADRAVVLAGSSGSGKSTLALAGSRAGLPVLSEETVFVQTAPSFCVWGLPGAVHLLETDIANGVSGKVRVRSGRVKQAIPIGWHRCMAEDAVLCMLERGEKVGIERFDPEEAVRMLTEGPEPGYDFYGSRAEEAIRAIANRGCWRLMLSRDPDAAIATVIAAFSDVDSIA
jgi:energy-coupling factor transporter ATP-binding protein EcfA2